ncbi:MAG: DNA replication and repair protein RecF [Oscillospiraceae bacterium]|jgi:DNA replication and repair protein RecF|nr:DNA replication and repair protein RecF [Oscillospiraceae bacterium]
MQLKSIKLTNFRNYRNTETMNFSAGTNIICGENAQGKTNLLEAVYYTCRGRSFRTRTVNDVIRFQEAEAEIDAVIEQNGRLHTSEVTLERNDRKRIYIDGTEQKTLTEYPFHAVLFQPEDLELGRGAAAMRRRWLDTVISALRPRYSDALTEHRKLYDSKLKLLKDIRENQTLIKVLEDFDILLAKADAVLIHYRALFCKRIAPLIAENTAMLSGESLTAEYRAVTSISHPEELKPSEICVKLLERQSGLRDAELASGNVLSGARKDDFTITLNELGSEFWSQGQARTVAVAMKLAEREFLKQESGEYPILLLDDVLSDLDERRRHAVLNKIDSGQTFITCCDADELNTKNTENGESAKGNGKWRVENGEIRAEQ